MNAFGKPRFQNELYELRRKLSPEWHEKLNKIEEAFLDAERSQADESNTYVKVYEYLYTSIIYSIYIMGKKR